MDVAFLNYEDVNFQRNRPMNFVPIPGSPRTIKMPWNGELSVTNFEFYSLNYVNSSYLSIARPGYSLYEDVPLFERITVFHCGLILVPR
ncbi:hypothetical protein HZH68_008382 [Vespula germanica]|uniref:Uncharacterized protein n=1 Tax=Vespula germanica TaxID=30212 RepID=A0A834K4M2_VESGE|nr:hypothetical protein HZH68_008382 [Vespula germanica]